MEQAIQPAIRRGPADLRLLYQTLGQQRLRWPGRGPHQNPAADANLSTSRARKRYARFQVRMRPQAFGKGPEGSRLEGRSQGFPVRGNRRRPGRSGRVDGRIGADYSRWRQVARAFGMGAPQQRPSRPPPDGCTGNQRAGSQGQPQILTGCGCARARLGKADGRRRQFSVRDPKPDDRRLHPLHAKAGCRANIQRGGPCESGQPAGNPGGPWIPYVMPDR